MEVSKIKGLLKYAVAVVIALVFSITVEGVVFMRDAAFDYKGDPVSLLDPNNCQTVISGYNVSGNRYEPTDGDPQLVFTSLNRKVDSVLISFTEREFNNTEIQIFYKVGGEEFSEANSTGRRAVPFAASYIILELPCAEYEELRIDIDGSFSLEGITVCDGPITVARVKTQSFSFLRFLVMFLAVGAALAVFIYWLGAKKNERSITKFEFLFCLVCFAFYFLWAVTKQYNYAPDEAMRFDVTRFLFEHNRLPVGDELLSEWGFSYAHLPAVLCNQLGYVFMKLASIFTSNEFYLLLSARMVSVCCATGAVYFIIKITKLLFKSPARWIMIVMISFMPQYCFLASYVNNDSVAFFGISMIVYAWLLGINDNWNYKIMTLLSLGISVCALSYYNSYAWILFSILFFVITYFYKNPKDYKGFTKLTGFIVGLTFLLIGYCFIRHLVIYGDLLGFNTTHKYGELYAVEALKPSNRFTLQERGISLKDMLLDPKYTWLDTSFRSFVGAFGYMQFWCPDYIYDLAKWFIIIGGIGFIGKTVYDLLIKRCRPNFLLWVLYISMAVCAVVTVALSIGNSYATDFQSQGRYCYPAFLPLAFFVAKGYEGILRLFRSSQHKYAVTAVLCTAFIGISLYVFKSVYLPT